MSNFLFNTGKYIHDEITGTASNGTSSNETITCDKDNLTFSPLPSESRSTIKYQLIQKT